MPMDKFARQTATQAHTRITETTNELKRRILTLEKALNRRSGFVGRCSLCGAPCKPSRRYCHAHTWAEGKD